MEGIGWQVDKEEISVIFENNLLFEEILETLKQQLWQGGCHVIFQASNFPVTSHLKFHVSRIACLSKYIQSTHLGESGRCAASGHIRYLR